MENNIEGALEKILTKEEVMEALSRHVENMADATLGRELHDDHGLRLLEVSVKGENPDEITEYEYRRKGSIPGVQDLPTTTITRIFYRSGEVISAESLEEYDEQTGNWKTL